MLHQLIEELYAAPRFFTAVGFGRECIVKSRNGEFPARLIDVSPYEARLKSIRFQGVGDGTRVVVSLGLDHADTENQVAAVVHVRGDEAHIRFAAPLPLGVCELQAMVA